MSKQGRPKGTLVALGVPSPLDRATHDEYDALLLIDWLDWKVHFAVKEDRTSPPPSAWHPYGDILLCSDNEIAWELALRDHRFRAIGITESEARELVARSRVEPRV
jgi:hypothetical protein